MNKRESKNNYFTRWAIGVPLLSGLMGLVVAVSGSNVTLFHTMNHLSAATGDALWAAITIYGDTLMVLALGLLWVGRRPDLVWALLLTALWAVLATHGLKPLFDIPRPPAVLSLDTFHVIGPAHRSGSFPSGHTITAFAWAGLVVLGLRRTSLSVLALVMATLVGISRMVVGVHWPLDVLGGAALGWLSAVLGLIVAQRWRWGVTATGQRGLATLLTLCTLALPFVDLGYPQARPLQWAVAFIALLVGGRAVVRLWKRPGPPPHDAPPSAP